MMSLAVLATCLLEAEFVAAVQIIVYAGAIMVLFVFVIMLLNAGAEERTNWSATSPSGSASPLGRIFLLLFTAHWIGAFGRRCGYRRQRGRHRGPACARFYDA